MAKPSSKLNGGQSVSPSNAEKRDSFSRDILPIPDNKHVGLTTYDAKDPNTKYPPRAAPA